MSLLLHNAPRPFAFELHPGQGVPCGDAYPDWMRIRLLCFQAMNRLGRRHKQLEWAVNTGPGVQVEWDGIEGEIIW